MIYFKKAIYIGLILFVLLVAILAFLLTTAPGLYTVIKIVNLTIPGEIVIKKPHGGLTNQFSFKVLGYTDDSKTIKLENGQVRWNPISLIRHNLIIDKIHAKKLVIEIKDTPEVIEETAQVDFELPHLPLDITLKKLVLDSVSVRQVGSVHVINNLALQARLNNQMWTINQLIFNYGDQQVNLQASGQPHLPYDLSATLRFSSIKKPKKKSNAFKGEINLTGNFTQYQWKGHFSGPVTGKLHGTLKNAHQINMEVDWHDGMWPINDTYELSSKEGTLTVKGTLNDLVIKSHGQFNKPVQGDLTIETTVNDQQINVQSILKTADGKIISHFYFDAAAKTKLKGEISTQSIDLRAFNLPLSQVSSNTKFSGRSAKTLVLVTNLSGQYLNHPMQATMNYSNQELSGKLTLGPNSVTFRGRSPYHWDAQTLLSQPSLLHPAFEGVNTTIKGDLKVTSPHKGQLDLTISPGSYRAIDKPSLPSTPFTGGHLNANLTPQGLNAKGQLTIDRNKRLNLTLALPGFSLLQSALPQQPIRSQLNLNIDALDFLEGMSEAIESPRGQLELKLTTSGTIGSPNIKGDLHLKNASVYLPKVDITYQPIQLNLQTENNQWTVNGSVVAQGQTLGIKGQGRFAPIVSGEVSILADNFPVIKTAEYSVNASPDLTIRFKPDMLDVQGAITIPTAELKPISFSDTVSLTEDAVFVSDKKEATSSPIKISSDINVIMGQNVAIDVKGLKGTLDGDVRIRKLPGSDPFGVGVLRVRDGKYKAHGQDLTIQDGQLIFTGGRITNPGIRIRAVRQFNNAASDFAASNESFDFTSGNLESFDLGGQITVGIEVTGRIDNPELKLFSIPGNLSQADILSMIILGKPSGQASRSGGQLLLTALSSMDLGSGTEGTQLINQLKNALGFDFSMAQSSTYDQATNEVNESTGVVVGRSISKRLYVSYNIGLFQEDGNVLTIKYLLNKYFSIQVTASEAGSGFDILYNHKKD